METNNFNSGENENLEYFIPVRVLTNRDPIILGKLSMREFFQWCFFFGLIYLAFNALPQVDFTFRLVAGAVFFMMGLAFIHSPINGLAGIEWGYMFLRFFVERNRHDTIESSVLNELEAAGRTRPIFNVQLQ